MCIGFFQYQADMERLEKEMPQFEQHIKQYDGLLNGDPDATDPDAAAIPSVINPYSFSVNRNKKCKTTLTMSIQFGVLQ